MISLLEVDALTKGAFATRVKTAALIAALEVPWVAPDFQSATPAERASRLVLAGTDLSQVILRAAILARAANVTMVGAGDVNAGDDDVIAIVSGILVETLGNSSGPTV